MKLNEGWEHHRRHSTKLSDVVRQGALAGLALVWMFRAEADGDPVFSRLLLAGAAVLVLGLIVDACQYAVLSHAWEVELKQRQRDLAKEHTDAATGKVDHAKVVVAEFAVPRRLNSAGYRLFWAKVGLIIVGLVFVFVDITTRVF